MSKETDYLKLFKYDKDTDNFDTTNFNITQALNNNWDKIDANFKSANTQLADITKTQDENAKKVNASINSIEKELENYNSYSSNKDSNGIFTVVEYKRSNNTLYMKSTLSNVDTNGNYKTDTWQFYDNAGINVIKTLTWTITYDSEGKITSKVVA